MDEIRDLVNLLHPKWAVEILSVLAEGPLRYTALQDKLSKSGQETVHPTVFTAALVHLQDAGLVVRDNDERHAYRLTPDGHDLVHELSTFAGWRGRRRSARRP